MRRNKYWPHLTLVLALALANGGCVLVPEMQDRVVELAVGSSTTVEFVVSAIGAIDEANSVNVLEGFDLAQILADAGIDVSDVKQIALSGVDYRVTVPDPEPSREIVDGAVTIARGASGALPLITNFNAGAGAASDWQAAPLDPSGAAVAEINAMLGEILSALPGSPPTSATTITYHVTAQSTPLSPANFTFEMKVKITVTGTVKVSVPT